MAPSILRVAVPPVLKGTVIAFAGPQEASFEDLKRWIELRKGQFSEVLDEKVDVLIATKKQFRKNVPLVAEARRRRKGDRRIMILDPGWLDECFFLTKRGRLPLPHKHCLLERDRREKLKMRQANRQVKAAEAAKLGWVDDLNFFHVYHDQSHFKYQIQMTRCGDLVDNSTNIETYTLILFESNAKPHLYFAGAKFSPRKGSPLTLQALTKPVGGCLFSVAFESFQRFFQRKTRLEWKDRLCLAGTAGPEHFQYVPPTGGRPVGYDISEPSLPPNKGLSTNSVNDAGAQCEISQSVSDFLNKLLDRVQRMVVIAKDGGDVSATMSVFGEVQGQYCA